MQMSATSSNNVIDVQNISRIKFNAISDSKKTENEIWNEMTAHLCEKSRYLAANLAAHDFKPLERLESGDILMFSNSLQLKSKAILIEANIQPGMNVLDLMREVSYDYANGRLDRGVN